MIGPHAVEPGRADDLAPTSFLQTAWWAAFKARHGWSSLVVRQTGRPETSVSILTRRLPAGMTLAYVPLADWDDETIVRLGPVLRPFLPSGTVCMRWDLASGTSAPIDPDSDARDELPAPPPRPLRKPPADVQPPDTVIVPLNRSLNDILAGMHKKTRYNIRLAEKKGVTVERAGVEALGDWYALYRETAARDRISIHSEAYYRDLFAFAPDLTLWTARWEGQLLAGNLVLRHGNTATYLYGASSNEHRNVMAPYALQWAAIQNAHADGFAEYDLFGIPPTDDPNHPMHGLYRFKNGFGGRRVHRRGAWDWVYRPAAWTLWTHADAARVWYYKVWKKR